MERAKNQKTSRRINFNGNRLSSQKKREEDGTPLLNISQGSLKNDEDGTPLLNISQDPQLEAVTGKTVTHRASSSPGEDLKTQLSFREAALKNSQDSGYLGMTTDGASASPSPSPVKDHNLDVANTGKSPKRSAWTSLTAKTVMHGPSSSPGQEMKRPLNFRKALARNNKEGGDLGETIVHVSSSSPGEEIKSPLYFNEAALKNSQDGSYQGKTIDSASASPVKDVKDDKLDVVNTGESLKRSAWTSPTRNLCIYWTPAQKYCRFGEKCHFVHGKEDGTRLARMPCPYHRGNEGCKFGTGCVFKH